MTTNSSNSSTTVAATVAAGAAVVAWIAYASIQKKKKPPSSSWALLSPTIYLDYNGTTPIYPEVYEAMVPYFTTHFGNPSSSHYYGTAPRIAIEHSRAQVLHTLLGVPRHSRSQQQYTYNHSKDDDFDNDHLITTDTDTDTDTDTNIDVLSSIWFTGSGTESDNLAIKLSLDATAATHQKQQHIVTTNVEHPAIEMYLQSLEKNTNRDREVTVTRVPVDTEGRVASREVIAALTSNTILCTIMFANNESGALQPVAEIAHECRQRGILFHTDAAQAAGKVSIKLRDIGDPDMVTIVGHKIGAPKGIACLYVRPHCLTEHGRTFSNNNGSGVLLIGGGQEFGRRGGTENTPYIVGLGKAAEMCESNLEQNSNHMELLRNRLLSNLCSLLDDGNGRDSPEDNTSTTVVVRDNGPKNPLHRLPNTLSVGIQNIQSHILLATLKDSVAASAGAACHSSGSGSSISSVLVAMQVPESFARGTLRLSIGPLTTIDEIDNASRIIADAAKEQRK